MRRKEPVLVVDTREQHPWCPPGMLMVSRALKVGDYSLVGYEDIIRVERKASIMELQLNLVRHWDQFIKNMSLLAKFPIHFLIITDSFVRLFRYNKYSNVRPEVFRSRLNRLMLETGIIPLFIGKTQHAESYVRDLLFKSVEVWLASKTPSQQKKLEKFRTKLGLEKPHAKS